MNTPENIELVRKKWELLKKKIGESLVDAGFRKRGIGYWKSSDTDKAFSGITFGTTVGRAKTERLEISFRILGGRREFHYLCNGKHGAKFEPSPAAAQFDSYFVEGSKGKVWELSPDISIDTIFAEISERLRNQGIPTANAMLDRQLLLEQLEAFRVGACASLSEKDAVKLLK